MERKRGASPASLPSHFRSRANSVIHHETRPLMVITSSTMHLVGVPLIILASLATGFILVWLKDILIPFVVAMFFVYLLRPLVNFLTQPCARCCHRSCLDGRYVPVASADPPGASELQMARIRQRNKPGSDGDSVAAHKSHPTTIRRSMSMSATYANGKPMSPHFVWGTGHINAPAGLSCCRVCTITRCPRWLAVLLALMIAFGVLSLLVLLIADAVNSFQSNDLKMYQHSAMHVTNMTITWINIMFHVDGSSLLKSIKTQVPVADVVQTILLTLIDMVGNTFLIMLVVLYLLFEQTSHPSGSLRRKIDEQIQRYIGIKTLISVGVGLGCYLVLGPLLNIKLAHLFGVLTFFLNYIPNVGPVIATAVPLPIVVLDPHLSTTPKLLAIALPTLIHLVVGNFIEPKVFGRSLELHPVVVLMALAFWFALWGVVGAILSIPVTAVIRIVLSHIDHPYARVIIRLLEGHIGLGSVELVEQIGVAEIEVDPDHGDGLSEPSVGPPELMLDVEAQLGGDARDDSSPKQSVVQRQVPAPAAS